MELRCPPHSRAAQDPPSKPQTAIRKLFNFHARLSSPGKPSSWEGPGCQPAIRTQRLPLVAPRGGETPPRAYSIAMAYARLGDASRSILWLEKPYQRHDWQMVQPRSVRVWDPIRSDPRFQDPLRGMNFRNRMLDRDADSAAYYGRFRQSRQFRSAQDIPFKSREAAALEHFRALMAAHLRRLAFEFRFRIAIEGIANACGDVRKFLASVVVVAQFFV